MILIHGKVESIRLEQQDKEIVLIMKDESQHRYLYENKKIFFILLENGNDEKKYITICQNIDNCIFSYTENKLKTTITIGEITYNNNFNI